MGMSCTRSVFIDGNGWRGCMRANDPYPFQAPNARSPTYEIIETRPNNVYKIRGCEYTDGSMGSSCSTLILQFKTQEYYSERKGKLEALVAVNLGQDLPAPAFDENARVLEIRNLYQGAAGNTTLPVHAVSTTCTEGVWGARSVRFRTNKRNQVVEIIDDTNDNELGVTSHFYYDNRELYFSFVHVHAPNERTETRAYYHNQEPFLCKLTYVEDPPPGVNAGMPTVVPCSELALSATIAGAKALLGYHDQQDFAAIETWCK